MTSEEKNLLWITDFLLDPLHSEIVHVQKIPETVVADLRFWADSVRSPPTNLSTEPTESSERRHTRSSSKDDNQRYNEEWRVDKHKFEVDFKRAVQYAGSLARGAVDPEYMPWRQATEVPVADTSTGAPATSDEPFSQQADDPSTVRPQDPHTVPLVSLIEVTPLAPAETRQIPPKPNSGPQAELGLSPTSSTSLPGSATHPAKVGSFPSLASLVASIKGTPPVNPTSTTTVTTSTSQGLEHDIDQGEAQD
ncbi:hypothetical protein ABKA04_003786 [Annulohypoxylon sp. FPYF3050]